MIARAKRVFPGVVVSVMLASPALAAHAGAPGSQPRKTATALEQRKSVSSSSISRHGSRTVASAPRSRRWRYASTNLKAVAFVNDATMWSEPGHEVSSGQHGVVQTGMASWYGGQRWHGHTTSSGERFDQEELTAAHATLPMGTMVRVTMLDGSRSVVVRITDRPGTRRRIIDLSQAAARELGLLSRGIAMVSLELP